MLNRPKNLSSDNHLKEATSQASKHPVNGQAVKHILREHMQSDKQAKKEILSNQMDSENC